MERRLISSGSAWEERYGYSRAVVADRRVYVAGTAPIMADGSPPPSGAYEQMQRCLEIVQRALADAGAGVADVVRTRVYMTDAAHQAEIMRAHGELFADVRPACTGIVCDLLDESWLCEIEVEAVLP
jgi:enamine deaminase RidA (YjgF/YER057c/UK114 family)